MEPAELVGPAGEIRIDIAIDLDAVFVVAPLVHHVVAIGVGELSQHGAVGSLHHPARRAADLPRRDLATRDILRLGIIVIHAILRGGELEGLFCGRRGRLHRKVPRQ